MTTELLPCPFCGKSDFLKFMTGAQLGFNHGCPENEIYVVCSAAGISGQQGCGASGQCGYTKEQAANYWNTRARPAAAEAVDASTEEAWGLIYNASINGDNKGAIGHLEAYRAATWSAAVAEAGKLAVDFKLDTSGMTPEEAAVQTAHQIACEIQGLKPPAGGE